MKLLLIRHALAGDREQFLATGRDDAGRPLTKQGRRRMLKGARGLKRVVDTIDVLASSPLVRAAQTAHIVSREYDGVPVVFASDLAPGAPLAGFLGWLRQQARGRGPDTLIACIGHEPDLGKLACWLVTGQRRGEIEFKKGGAGLLELDAEPQAGKARLLWLIAPKELRRLA